VIDLHVHLLPGVDDGPADLAAALALARECAATETPTVVATPHFDDWTRAVLPDVAAAQDRVAALQAEFDHAGIPLQLLAGGETFLTPELPRLVRDGRVPTLAGGPWLLVETPMQQKPLYLEQVLFELQAMGVRPLLAHPERYGWLHARPDALGELVERGVCAQVTASSLAGGRGGRGGRQRALAETFVRRGYAQIIASDRHKAGTRGASLLAGYEAAAALVGAERARRLVEDNPALIVAGAPLPIELDEDGHERRERGGGSWLRRWFRR
jgi:protein-tyrosine phosphatase